MTPSAKVYSNKKTSELSEKLGQIASQESYSILLSNLPHEITQRDIESILSDFSSSIYKIDMISPNGVFIGKATVELKSSDAKLALMKLDKQFTVGSNQISITIDRKDNDRRRSDAGRMNNPGRRYSNGPRNNYSSNSNTSNSNKRYDRSRSENAINLSGLRVNRNLESNKNSSSRENEFSNQDSSQKNFNKSETKNAQANKSGAKPIQSKFSVMKNFCDQSGPYGQYNCNN
ncbi:MAG: hypothetical protein MHPSP_003682 [Paramarteilia canceri]